MAAAKDKTETAPVTEKAPRLSRVERLKKELDEANAKEQAKRAAKAESLKADLAKAQEAQVKANEKVAALEAEIRINGVEGPIVTDGVGDVVPADDEPEDSPAGE